jgi:hypothetical protein
MNRHRGLATILCCVFAGVDLAPERAFDLQFERWFDQHK